MDPSGLVRAARRRAGLTQDELAERAGTSQPAVARCERGGVVPTLPSLNRLLRACGEELVLSCRPHRPSRLERLVITHRDEILEAARRRGASNVRLYGSVARGEDTRTSDVDVLVDLRPGRTLMTLAALSNELSDLLGADVEVATEDVLRPEVRRRALAEAIKL
jgi:predicted nucleotidyltransferase/DNA-binding XRE family transcriptional regulator